MAPKRELDCVRRGWVGDNRAVIPLLKSMRPPQWVKNFFVLLPLVFAERLFHEPSFLRALLAFAVFCALSSAVYLFNDLLDRDKDRAHPIKKMRPLAAGTLSPTVATGAALALAGAGLAGAFFLGTVPLVVALVYVAQNLLYTLALKHVVIVDIMIISLGFVLRVVMGGAAIGVAVSDWILLCTIFLSLFLAVSKRRHELVLLRSRAAGQRQVLEDYGEPFLDQMTSVVTASTLLAYALYATTDANFDVVFRLVYTVPFVIFGIFRYLYLAYQVGTPRSPTEAMLTDAPFVANLMLWGLAVLAHFYL